MKNWEKIFSRQWLANPGNSPQFIPKDFKEFIKTAGMPHVRTAPHHPQNNGKIKRHQRTIKHECIRSGALLSLDDARTVVDDFTKHYIVVPILNNIGYITPEDTLPGREKQISKDRDSTLKSRPDQTGKQNGKEKLHKYID